MIAANHEEGWGHRIFSGGLVLNMELPFGLIFCMISLRNYQRNFFRENRYGTRIESRSLRTRTFTKLAEPNLYDLGSIFILTFELLAISVSASESK